ncbi:hypothetical protein SEVIR_9G547500v4 [Setaria viridis]|uniref:DUF4378 domain-containing protein n=1 Tax=Setaria viridis TaxID=4556 RepID=A0A4U6T8Q4_SETVI|nr:uncharacterized protein LOC117838414 [Setaria viridis]TKV98259.1 hypothetical protein SEVIR_9G547500v2 [Setaria viridis]
MINLFDLSVGASAKVASRDGSPVRGTQSERKEYAGSKTVTGCTRRSSSDRSGGTPMKMLIAQEMAKEGDANQKTTNVVARLMGLDDNADLPKPLPSNRRTFPDGHLSATLARVNNQMSFEKRASSMEDVEYKDVYEVGYQPPRGECLSNESPRRRPNEDHDKRRMDLVRQKFVEAKQLASHDNLLQSKEFHDALEVLNSNKDLFLKFLEEPNSLFAKQSGELHSAPTSPQRKRITVLKPSKSVDTRDDKAIKRQKNHAVDGNRVERSNSHKSDAAHVKVERLPKHTRIVVLKPTSAIASMEQFDQNYHADLDDSEAPAISRRLSDEIDWSVHGMCRRHNESNPMSAYRPYDQYAEEEGASLSDSDIGTPTSRHSWEYIYRFSNPYFGSSLSHASCSPESHVTKEAKKYTSDRWAIVPSSEITQGKVLVRRSLSTLGEMLAMPDMKKEEVADQASPDATSQLCSNEPTVGVSSNCAVGDGEGESSLRKISRSRSVPVSSSAFDSLRLDGGCSEAQHKESTASKDVKPKNGKSSLKGKISSFFSKRKKTEKEKVNPSPLGTPNSQVLSASTVVIDKSDVPEHVCTNLQNGVAFGYLEERFENGPTVVPLDELEAPSTSKSPVSLEKALPFEIRNSHFDQPSPTSVLDAQFDDVNEKSPISSESAITVKQEPLSRSLPIGSIARTLSWDDASQEASLCCTKDDSHEQEQYEFVEKILTSVGFCNEKAQDIFVRWHSLDCPLDPVVLDQLLERKVEDAKCRERRSNQRLLIDSVNAALLDIGQRKLWGAYPCTARYSNAPRVATCDVLVTDEAWRLVKSWLFDDENDIAGLGDNAGLAADWVVDKEIHGKGWSEMLRSEVDEISKEICGDVLSELVGEAFSELADAECH